MIKERKSVWRGLAGVGKKKERGGGENEEEKGVLRNYILRRFVSSVWQIRITWAVKPLLDNKDGLFI